MQLHKISLLIVTLICAQAHGEPLTMRERVTKAITGTIKLGVAGVNILIFKRWLNQELMRFNQAKRESIDIRNVPLLTHAPSTPPINYSNKHFVKDRLLRIAPQIASMGLVALWGLSDWCQALKPTPKVISQEELKA